MRDRKDAPRCRLSWPFQYFWLTVKHKFFVLLAGLKTKAPWWRLLVHDWTKFTPAEYPHYQRQFFGSADDPEGFARAWLHHQNANPHHWEYWIPRTGHNRSNPPMKAGEPLAMPMWAVREMVADWLGASRVYEGFWPDINNWTWYENNKDKMKLHPLTKQRLGQVLAELGYRGE